MTSLISMPTDPLWRYADYSTVDFEAVRRLLKPYKMPSTYHYSDYYHGSHFAPPGHPEYFLWNIYTRHGNAPPKEQPDMAIILPTGFRGDPRDPWEPIEVEEYALPPHGSRHPKEVQEERDALVDRIYKPLPWEHPRVQEWVRQRKHYDSKGAPGKVYEWYPGADINAVPMDDFRITHWWERLAEKPVPADCPGGIGRPHPVNTTRCQFCGWRQEDDQT